MIVESISSGEHLITALDAWIRPAIGVRTLFATKDASTEHALTSTSASAQMDTLARLATSSARQTFVVSIRLGARAIINAHARAATEGLSAKALHVMCTNQHMARGSMDATLATARVPMCVRAHVDGVARLAALTHVCPLVMQMEVIAMDTVQAVDATMAGLAQLASRPSVTQHAAWAIAPRLEIAFAMLDTLMIGLVTTLPTARLRGPPVDTKLPDRLAANGAVLLLPVCRVVSTVPAPRLEALVHAMQGTRRRLVRTNSATNPSASPAACLEPVACLVNVSATMVGVAPCATRHDAAPAVVLISAPVADVSASICQTPASAVPTTPAHCATSQCAQ